MEQVILIVDDEPNLLHSLSRALHNEPYKIYTARTAEEAIEILKGHSVDLIVSDENMEGMRGSDFLAWVATHLPGIPRIMLTGQDHPDVQRRAVEQGGIVAFFTKPCSVEALATTIREALEERRSSQLVSDDGK